MRARTLILPAGLVAITALAQWLLIQFSGAATTYLIFALPVIASAWLAGFSGGLVANALSLVVAFVMPSTALWSDVHEGATIPIRLALMAAVGLLTSGIVERLRSKEHELRRRTAELEQITDTMPVYVVRCAADDTFLFVNHSYAHRFGLTPAQVIGRRIPDVLGGDAYRALQPYLERVLRGEQVRFETEVNYKGLGPRTMSCEYVPERGPDAVVRSFVGVIVDVTDQRRIAAAAEADRVRAQLASEAAELGTWEWHAPEGTLAWSARACELFGLSPGTPMTVDLLMATVHPEDRERVRAALTRSADPSVDGQLAHADYRIIRVSDGEQRWIRGTGRIEARGGHVRAFGTVQDVTEHYEARAALEQALSREHDARTHAEEASRLKDEFLATLSHELRTPLNAILGYTRMLRTGTVPHERSELALEIIERNARLQRQLVDDILDVSRIITGKLRLTPTVLDPVNVVELALDSIRPAADAKRLVLALIVRDDGLRVLADPDRLQQIVWNLLTNAVKFTPAGGRIAIELGSEGGEHAVMTVTDTGVGIRPDFLPHVFERFRQGGSDAATPDQGGLGLGLAIVRHLTELQGGTISAHSEGPGKGSTFTLRLPLRPRDTSAAWVAHGVQAGSHGPLLEGARLDGLRVLIVDQDRDSLRYLERTLGDRGARVRSVLTASDGLRELDREVPDVILSDIGLPGVDGREFITTVRERPNTRGGRVPAIALSTYESEEDRRAALSAGYQAHLTKPCDPRLLTGAITAITGTQPS